MALLWLKLKQRKTIVLVTGAGFFISARTAMLLRVPTLRRAIMAIGQVTRPSATFSTAPIQQKQRTLKRGTLRLADNSN